MDTVKVSDFNSVLQITFGLNLIFVVLELRPIFARRFGRLERRYQPALSRLWDDVRANRGRGWWLLLGATFRFAAYISLDALAVFLAGYMSLWSMGYLIAAAYHPELRVAGHQMRGLLILSFSVPSGYCVLSWLLLRSIDKRLCEIEKRQPTTETHAAPSPT